MQSPRKYSPEYTWQFIRQWCDKAERPHSKVREKLISWGVPYDEREELIGRLIEVDVLNETRFASAFVHDKFEFNKWGANKIKQALKRLGVSDRNITDSLKLIPAEDNREAILHLIKKKTTQWSALPPYQRKMKVAKYLMTKGFEGDAVWNAVNTYFKG